MREITTFLLNHKTELKKRQWPKSLRGAKNNELQGEKLQGKW